MFEPTDYNWTELPPRYKWNINLTEDTIQALGSPKVGTLVEECNQFIAAGLIESPGKKLQEIFITTSEVSQTMKPNTSKKRKNHHNTRNYGTTQSVEQ